MTDKELYSKATILQHNHDVGVLMLRFVQQLIDRAQVHDATKLEEPEFSQHKEYTDQAQGVKFGSEEYNKLRQKFQLIHEYHFDRHRHHPEHFPNGINDMNLVDLIEMMCDWKAASVWYKGDMQSSLKVQRKRLKISPQLMQIIKNTAKDLGLYNER